MDPAILARGLALDRHPLAGNLWRTLSNVEIFAGSLRRIRYRSLLVQTPDTLPLRGISQLQTAAGIKRIYTGDAGKLYGYDFSTLTASGAFTGVVHESPTTLATSWSLQEWGDWMFATNGLDQPQVAKNSLTFAASNTDGLLTRAQVFKKVATFLLAFNTQLGSDVIQWANADSPEDWSVGTNKTGGNIRIRELDGPIMGACELGNGIAVYGMNSMFRLGVRPSPFYFGYDRGPSGIGLVGKLAVCADGPLNYGVSRQGIWRTDGFSFQYIDALEGVEIREWLQENVNWSQASKIVARKNEIANAIEFAFPLGASLEPNFVLRWNLAQQQWTSLPRSLTGADERRVTTASISTTAGGRILLDEQGTNTAEDNTLAEMQTRPLMLGLPNQAAYVDEIQFLVSPPIFMEWRIGTQHTLDEDPQWSSWALIPQNMQVSHLRREGVYFQLQFRSGDLSGRWQFAGFLLFGEGDGLDRTRSAFT